MDKSEFNRLLVQTQQDIRDAGRFLEEANDRLGRMISDSPGEPSEHEEFLRLVPLLDLIAKYESNGNYCAYYAHGRNKKNPELTAMTIGEVLVWQKSYTDGGSPSSAAGRYQIIRRTLASVAKKMELEVSTTLYNEATQDAMAVHLLEGRKLRKYLDGAIKLTTFGNLLAREWAAFPVHTRIKGYKGRLLEVGQSYYAGDGLNKARVPVGKVAEVLRGMRRFSARRSCLTRR